MRHDAIAEECRDPLLGPVEKLVGNEKFGGLVLLFERADSGNREDALDAKLLHAVNIGAKIQLRRQQAMSPAMPRQESNFASRQRSQNVSVGRPSERSVERYLARLRQALHRIQTTAADDADLCLCQNFALLPDFCSATTRQRARRGIPIYRKPAHYTRLITASRAVNAPATAAPHRAR